MNIEPEVVIKEEEEEWHNETYHSGFIEELPWSCNEDVAEEEVKETENEGIGVTDMKSSINWVGDHDSSEVGLKSTSEKKRKKSKRKKSEIGTSDGRCEEAEV
ncbi:hypothetical protein Avbf_13616 [Armadillidium vulgare]|nr:hypothetical protein Avbf_13616 [Armadillidium vulgare]